jgi:putative PIN family toxin of toxin-antitoxin system
MRVVIDTNMIIASRFSPRSSSARIIGMCIDGRLEAVYSPAIKDENLFILEKVRPDRAFIDTIIRFYSRATLVRPEEKVKLCEDPDDDKYFEAALAAKADFIISNDRHLLDHDGWRGIKVVRPGEFVRTLEPGK